MAKRKYSGETAIQVSMKRFQLFQVGDLNNAKLIAETQGEHYSVYIITERPKIHIKDAQIIDDSLIGKLELFTSEGVEQHDLAAKIFFDTKDMTFECPYPHNIYYFKQNGVEYTAGKTSLVVPTLGPEYLKFGRHEVKYIGQSQGYQNPRDALDRLKNHEKLVLIQHDVATHRPHNEVWLFIMSFEASTLLHFGETSINAEYSVEDSLERSYEILESATKEPTQIINIAEAGLINYFKPEYNEKFKENFPSKDHKGYKNAYKLDANGLIISFETSEAFISLWSPTINPSQVHIAKFPLDDPNIREFFVDVLPGGRSFQ